ncbi:hypothetical protein WBP07_01635 [Novosphingobium sp. BL-8A]|uniref:hypothetical protein n=1 Tax=Novosphingobium sp. BL-8A TaxID=3127639 RepID=UPI00375829D3
MIKTCFLSATTALAGALIVAGGAGMAVPALAQASWSLQPGADATKAQRAPGPVDAQNPVVARPSSAPDDTPSPQVTLPAAPPPTVKAPAVKAPEKAPATTAPAARPTVAPAQTATQAPARAPAQAQTPAREAATSAAPPSPVASPAQQPTLQAPLPSPPPSAPPVGEQTTTPAAPVETPPAAPASHWPEWWLAIPVALLLAGLGVFALLRRRAAPATAWAEAGLEPEPEEEDDTAEAAQPVAPTVAPAPSPVPAPAPAIATVPPQRATPAAPPPPKPLVSAIVSPRPAPVAIERAEVTFEPVLMRQSLVYATLVYRMTLTAPAEGLPEGAAIAADMISAHASLSQAEQLAPDPASVPPRHRFDPLGPGETREVKGEIQLPLNAIRPVRQGNAMLFVPLLRLFLALPDGSIERRVFSLGLPGEGAGLAPVRIDTGPRDHAPIHAREIDGARSHSGPHVPQAAE